MFFNFAFKQIDRVEVDFANFVQHVRENCRRERERREADTRTKITEMGEGGRKGGKPVRESAEVEKSRW